MKPHNPAMNNIKDHYEESMSNLDSGRLVHNPLHKTLERAISGSTPYTSECTFSNGIHRVKGYLRNSYLSSVEVKLEQKSPHQLTIDVHVSDFGSRLPEHRGIAQKIANIIESNYQKITTKTRRF